MPYGRSRRAEGQALSQGRGPRENMVIIPLGAKFTGDHSVSCFIFPVSIAVIQY